MPWKLKSHAEWLRPQRRKVYDQAYEKKRLRDPALATAKALRNTRRWQTVRDMALAQHPHCQDPQGRHPGQVRPATQVHHKQPLNERPDLAYALENLCCLCASCHAYESAAERQTPL